MLWTDTIFVMAKSSYHLGHISLVARQNQPIASGDQLPDVKMVPAMSWQDLRQSTGPPPTPSAFCLTRVVLPLYTPPIRLQDID
jgi:hypothetical protein